MRDASGRAVQDQFSALPRVSGQDGTAGSLTLPWPGDDPEAAARRFAARRFAPDRSVVPSTGPLWPRQSRS